MTLQSQDDRSIPVRVTLVIQAALGVAVVLFVWRRDWENVFLTSIVIALALLPTVLSRWHYLIFPPEFQLICALFVSLSLFLGSAVDLYHSYWWWDLVLHISSGFLFGIVGFLVIFLLNKTDRIPKTMRPSFVCLFAVTFSVFVGVVWELFEFAVDRIAPSVNMQSGETGVADTMKDLSVDILGAVIVAGMSWVYLKTGRYSFLADALRGFMRRNPRLFRRRTSS